MRESGTAKPLPVTGPAVPNVGYPHHYIKYGAKNP